MQKNTLPNWVFWGVLLLAGSGFAGCNATDSPSASPQPAAKQANPETASWSLSLQSSGGFAGVREELNLTDSGMAQFTNLKASTQINANIGPDDLITLSKLVKNLSVEARMVWGNTSCRDCFNHILTITHAGKTRTFRINGPVEPDTQLAQLLTQLSLIKSQLRKPASD